MPSTPVESSAGVSRPSPRRLDCWRTPRPDFVRTTGICSERFWRWASHWTVCTIYDAIPGLGHAERAGLALFNDVILHSAVEVLAPVIALSIVCDHAHDYS